MTNLKVELASKYMTSRQVRERLNLSRWQFDIRVERGVLPKPTFIDKDSGVRYFDEAWLITAKAIMDSLRERGLFND